MSYLLPIFNLYLQFLWSLNEFIDRHQNNLIPLKCYLYFYYEINYFFLEKLDEAQENPSKPILLSDQQESKPPVDRYFSDSQEIYDYLTNLLYFFF